jgi:hypothetical protein
MALSGFLFGGAPPARLTNRAPGHCYGLDNISSSVMAEGWSRNDTNARASNQLAAGPLLIHLIDLRGARRRRSELPRTRRSHGHHSRFGRVEIRRGFCRSDISVSAPFVWWCLSGSIMAFHIPLIEPDRWLSRFGGSETPSPTADRARSTVRPRSGRKMREWISPALAYRLTLCLTQATGVKVAHQRVKGVRHVGTPRSG